MLNYLNFSYAKITMSDKLFAIDYYISKFYLNFIYEYILGYVTGSR